MAAPRTKPPGSEIKHLVHIILENRSFDSILGFLYDETSLPSGEYFRGLAFPGGHSMGSKPSPKGKKDVPPISAGTAATDPITQTGMTFSQHHFSGSIPIPARIPSYLDPNAPFFAHAFSKDFAQEFNRWRPLSKEEIQKYSHWPPENPGEEHEHTTAQLYGVDITKLYDISKRPPLTPAPTAIDWSNEPTMQGFPDDYAAHRPKLQNAEEVIMTSIPKQLLPTMHMLAHQHAVCDEWFCSVPTQTWPNRLFSWTGSSAGIVNNKTPLRSGKRSYTPTTDKISEHFDDIQEMGQHFNIFEHMDAHHRNNPGNDDSDKWSWRVYSHLPYLDSFTMLLYRLAVSEETKPSYCPIDDLKKHAKEGTLAAYSLIEPLFMPSLVAGKPHLHNDHHPGETWEPGERAWKRPAVWETDRMLLELYKDLFGKDAMYPDSTMLVITYDEHGGCYDHVAPPKVGEEISEDAPKWPSTGFRFERFGVRVPTILVSPRIAPNTILHAPQGSLVPFDHTSILHSIRERWPANGIEASPMTDRDRFAPTIWSVLNKKYTGMDDFRASFELNAQICETALLGLEGSEIDPDPELSWTAAAWMGSAADMGKSLFTGLVRLGSKFASSSPIGRRLNQLFIMPHTSRGPAKYLSSDWDQNMREEWALYSLLRIDASRLPSILRGESGAFIEQTPESMGISAIKPSEQDASPSAPSIKKQALIVGATYEGTPFEKLAGTINDADLMEKLLIDKFDFEEDHIIKLSGPEASKLSILEHFQKIAQSTGVDDVFVFYFAGHGSEIEDTTKPNGCSQVIVPSGCTTVSAVSCITDVEIEAILKKNFLKREGQPGHFASGSKNVTLIFDSCHSGDMTRDPEVNNGHEPPKSTLRQVPSLVRRSVRGDLDPSTINMDPDWQFSEYSDYVAISSCHASSSAQEMPMDVKGSASKVYGVFTFFLDQTVRNMMDTNAKSDFLNWRHVIRNVQAQIRHATFRIQIPQLEGQRDWVPFGTYSRPAVPYLEVSEVKKNNLRVKLKGGSLHGVTLSSTWIVTTKSGSQWSMIISKVAPESSNEQHEDGVVASGWLDETPLYTPAASPVAPRDQIWDSAIAVCTGILASHLPSILVNDSTTEKTFSLKDMKSAFPTFYHDVTDPSLADVIVNRSSKGVLLEIPSLGRGWMTSSDLKIQYAELSRIGHFIRMLRHHPTLVSSPSMLRNMHLGVEELTSRRVVQENGIIFIQETGLPLYKVVLENNSGNIWYMTLLIFHPDMAIEQRYPAPGNTTDLIRVERPFRCLADPGALRDGHGNARIILRAIATSDPADLSTLAQQKVTLSQDPTIHFMDTPPPATANVRKELSGLAVLDREVILQPTSIEAVIHLGLMYNPQWTVLSRWAGLNLRTTFDEFVRLRTELLEGPTPAAPVLSTPIPDKRYTTSRSTPWANKTIVSHTFQRDNEIIGHQGHVVVLLTCFDPRDGLFGSIATRSWVPYHLQPTYRRRGSPSPILTGLDWDWHHFDGFMGTEGVTGFTIVADRNAAYALKYHLTVNKPKWTEKLKSIVFLNAIHLQPQELSFAGLIAIMPHWRSVGSFDQVTEWLRTINDLDDQFLDSPFSKLPIISVNTFIPQALFKIKPWNPSSLAHHTSIELLEVPFFDLPFHKKLKKHLKSILSFTSTLTSAAGPIAAPSNQ